MSITTKTVDIGGKELHFELGKIAKQANGSVVIRLGDTMVLTTACAEDNIRQGVDFMPLTVDYRENAYAGGRIPGGFFKREGRPTEREILTCRVIDRGLRPQFPDGWRRETQIIAWVMSADEENSPDVLGMTGASMALMAAKDIPFTTPLAGVRVGRVNGEFVLFPTYAEQTESEQTIVADLTAGRNVLKSLHGTAAGGQSDGNERPTLVARGILTYGHGLPLAQTQQGQSRL